MTIEAKLDRLISLHEQLLAKFDHIGAATKPADKPAAPKAPVAQPPAKPTPTPTPAATALDYEKDVKPLALTLAGKNRPKLVELLAKYKVDVAPKLKPEQYVGFVTDVKAALAS